MKKLIIPEGFGEDADKNVKTPSVKTPAKPGATTPNVNAVKNQINTVLRTGGLPQPKPEKEADINIKSAGDTTTLAEILAMATDPSILWMYIADYGPGALKGTASAYILWKVGKWAWKKRFNKNTVVDIKSLAEEVTPQKYNRIQKALKSKSYQKYLIDELYNAKWITKKEYLNIKKDINYNNFKIKFRSKNELRKEFKTFVIACMKHDRISYKDFRRYSGLPDDQIYKFMEAKIKFKRKTNLKLTKAEEALEKHLDQVSRGVKTATAIDQKIKTNKYKKSGVADLLTKFRK